jgi:hypothetical protein
MFEVFATKVVRCIIRIHFEKAMPPLTEGEYHGILCCGDAGINGGLSRTPGLFEVFATKVVRCMMGTSLSSVIVVSSGK